MAQEAMIKARNEGRELLAQGPGILRAAAKRSREFDMALSTVGDVTFNFESTDISDATAVPAPGAPDHADHPRKRSPICRT